MRHATRLVCVVVASAALLGAGRGNRSDDRSDPPPKPAEAAPSPPVKLPTNAPANAPKVPASTPASGTDLKGASASATGISLEAMVTMLQMRADAQRDRIEAMRQEIRELRAREDGLIRQLEKQGVRPDQPLLPTTQPASSTAATRPSARPADAQVGQRVVFLIDASASMADEFGSVSTEIVKAVHAMPAKQGFTVLAVRDADVVPLSEGFTPGGEAGARAAQAFLSSIQPAGAGDLLLGLGAALRLRPDAVWLVSDGDFPGGDHTFALVARLTAGRPARINTIVCLNDTDDANSAPVAANLARLAREHHGTCLGFSPDRGPLGVLNPLTEPARPAAGDTARPAPATAPLPTGPSVFDSP